MALTESDIKIIIAAELKAAGFNAAQKATDRLNKNFNKLRSTSIRTFTAIAGIAALKKSVRAFAENDAAITNLTKSLDNLGFTFESPALVNYLENLEKTTAVVKEELFPAFRNLTSATLDTAKAQELLGIALDISAGTGTDLTSVTIALTRAYNGNYTSLGKIQTAYTSAELKALGFNKAVELLQDQFSGQAAAAADTYQAKITRLNIAFNDAAEAIGEGVVDALEALGGGNYQKGLDLIAAGGEKIGDAFRAASKAIAITKFVLQGGLFKDRKEIEAFALAINSAFAPPDAAKQRTYMRERAKYLKDERKQTEKIRIDREKASKALEKEKNDQKTLADAAKRFDMERIQIQAALQGKLTEEERIRVELQKAILNENAAKAEKLQADLKKAQEDTKLLSESMSKFVASDPFAFWATYFATQKKERDELDTDLKEFDANDPFAFWGTYWAMQKKERDTLDKDIKAIEGEDPFKVYPDAFKAQKDAANALDKDLKGLQAGDPFPDYPDAFKAQKDAADALDKNLKGLKAGDPFPGWDEYIAARIAGVQALKAELASLATAQTAADKIKTDTGDGTVLITDGTQTTIIGEELPLPKLPEPDVSMLAYTLPGLENYSLGDFDIFGQLKGLGGVNLSVNVEGSIISQEDFSNALLAELYKLQDQGVPLVTTSTTIGN